ncbi:UDP-N-acetylmuramoyl-L-alanine--D-glutamate ligase [Anaerobranca gottschalkii]|uniref:UDP-N-acetylmuramoylalanine--D-glutamate ligase n=1 Tax=Anaerobranca gottschalkii DSM 13577 TaxID=1120990 RepID=A0A1H9YVG5_9FIRM|nr:UDP-N-acetylmuramoyl-L-alanine--D-glutamate ligase [Anaerobranca gottschalkii]SES73104.1 UDP-N-acetylmuramoylalanine--D-glutamate ligase [Anaerobranca gottschalkii DSM 13577]
MEFKGKYILIVGAGRTGIGIAKVLHDLGAKVIVNDGGEESKLEKDLSILKSLGIEYVVSKHPFELLHPKPEFIVKNPGISLEIPFIQYALSLGIPVISDIELINSLNTAPLVAITGTNGKTTVTSFIGHLFAKANYKEAVGGNIGISIAESIYKKDLDIIIAEVSSFQLECTFNFKPYVSVITNFSPDHLDRHKTFENYINQKKKIFLNQDDNDHTVLNFDNKICRDISSETKGNLYWFSAEREVPQGAYIEGNDIYWKRGSYKELICSAEIINILGNFNRENILAGVIVGKIFNLSNEVITEGIRTFNGVEHRLEFVGEINGVKYYNDSKATNSDSTIKALEAFKEPVTLLLGGYDKGEDFWALVQKVKEKCKKVILFGATGERIRGFLNKVEYRNYYHVKTFEEAVFLAKEKANPGEIVLLSPACASWDEFQNFEQRGRFFKELIYR